MSIRIENDYCQWLIAEDGVNLRFLDKIHGIDWALHNPPAACAYVKKDGWRADACRVSFADGILTLYFSGAAGKAEIAVEIHAGFFVFTVLRVEGDFDELAFINIPTRLKAQADEPFSASAIALSLQANVEELPGPQEHLWSAAYRRFGFQGAQSGLVTAPFAKMRDYLKEMVGAAPGVPHSPLCGPWALDAELPRRTNIMACPSESDVDDWIQFCQQLGITSIEFSGAIDYGSYLPNPKVYPRGYDSVKAVTDKLHDAGIISGLHTMSFSIVKNCSWVTPVPDPRLAKERSYTLAAGISAEATEIPIVEDTSDLPELINYFIRRSMTLQIGDELIEFSGVRKSAPYAVLECRRGVHGTKAASHRQGAPVHHLKECWGCFAPDGDSTLYSEVAGRIAKCLTDCGFDFCYLDGLDGAHIIGGEEARWYYSAKFTFEVFRQLSKPMMMEMATFHHHLWYVRSRMQAWDHCVRGHKKFINMHVYSNAQARRMFLPLHLGWTALFPWVDSEHEPTYRDDIEYLWSKSLATDANFTLQCIGPESMRQGAWLKDFAETIRTYEKLRQKNVFPEEIKAKLSQPGSEFQLLKDHSGTWNFRPVQTARHKVEALDGQSNRWSFRNRFESQPLSFRLTALNSVAAYDSPEAITLVDFQQQGQFRDPGPTDNILNSGKIYTYQSSAPGVSSAICPAPPDGPAGICGRWSAVNQGLPEVVPTSAPDDRYSLLDHCEREYRLHQASWTSLVHYFPEPLDLSGHRALGLWLKGDGKGELANLILNSRSYGETHMQHYIPVDFTGWRYFELVEPESERFDDYSWPFGCCQYEVYRTKTNFANSRALFFWYNQIPRSGSVECLLSPVKALPLLEQKIVHPALSVNGQQVVFPVELSPGQYLECDSSNCRLFDKNGDFLGDVTPQNPLPELQPGDNDLLFSCRTAPAQTRAWINIITRAEQVLNPN
ncbi:MAG: hypothetical protein GX902_12190 [Lentisphaerae bacterium]|nr:hypothetical protein [Lentisphaerota bacterium]